MKKIKNVLLLVLVLFIATACFEEDSNKLSCTSPGDDSEILYEFEDDKVSKIILVTVQHYGSEEEASSTFMAIKNIADNSATNGYKIELKVDGSNIKVNSVYTIDKLTADEKLNLTSNGLSIDKSRKEIKEEMEVNAGVSCK